MEIFTYENYMVNIDPKALFITAFKDVWEKYKNKEDALSELSYIWFVGSYTSDFASYIDADQRRYEVVKSVYGGDVSKLKIDDKTEIAIAKLEELQDTPALAFLKSAYLGMDKIKRHIDDTTVSDGRDAESLIKIISQAPTIIKSLGELEKRVKEEAGDSGRIKGNRKKGMFEDTKNKVATDETE